MRPRHPRRPPRAPVPLQRARCRGTETSQNGVAALIRRSSSITRTSESLLNEQRDPNAPPRATLTTEQKLKALEVSGLIEYNDEHAKFVVIG